MADLKEKIQKQIEFYFSDSNYPRDKFLRSLAAQNEEGFVPLNTIATFTRMKQLSEDIELVKEAVKASSIVQLNADGTMLKRIAALPDEDTSNPRTIYAKGFPHETGYTIEDVESVFAPIGKVLSVRIRKTKFDKKQKPSVFVELATAEEAKKATEAKLTFKDSPLTVMMKQDYTEQKKQERKTRLEEKKKRKSDDTESKEEVDESKSNNNNKKQKTNKPEEEKTSRISHSIAKFTGVGEKVTRENIKEIIGPLGTIAFVDFQQNESEGYIRFENEEQALRAVEEFAKSPKELGGKTPTIVLLEADDEKAYWDKVHQGKKDFKKGGKGGKGKKTKEKKILNY